MLTTPLQLASAIARLATRGGGTRPHLLREIKDNSSGVSQAVSLEALPRITLQDEQHWDEIHDAMVAVVHGPTGTARRISKGAPYRIAGKTGTAQVAGLAQEDDEAPQLTDVAYHLRDHALFVAYAPADNPQVAVAVIAEHSGSGGAIAAPIARRILDVALGHDQDPGVLPRQP